MAEEHVGSLTAEEAAYFDSRGEKPLATEQATQQEAPQQEPPPAENQQEEQQVRDEKGRFVPHQALHAEREEHKKTKAQVEELRQFKAVMEDRWNTMLAAGNAQEKPKDEDPAPDPNADIFAYSQWQQRQFTKLQESIAQKERAEAEARKVQEAETAIWSEWRSSATAYAAQQADFGDAATFLSEARDKQLSALGIVNGQFRDKAARDAQINAELKQIIVAAKQQGLNPAEAVYQIAQQYGYAPKAPDPNTLKLPEGLERIGKAQEAAKTIGQAATRAGGDELSLETVMAMPRHEFDAWVNEPKNRRLFDRLMGG